VNAVATSPSSSMRSEVPVGKNGSIRVKEEINNFGRAYMIDSCSNMTLGELNDAKKATWRPRMLGAFEMNKFGNPSANVLKSSTKVQIREVLSKKWNAVETGYRKYSKQTIMIPTYKIYITKLHKCSSVGMICY
jgi:hypothetical protein